MAPGMAWARGRAARHLRLTAPYAVVLALALGAVVWLGANVANATPSKERPFGWPGPSNFEGGVATARPQLLLAATVPAVLVGWASMRDLSPSRTSRREVALLVMGDAGLVVVAVFAATLLASAGVSRASGSAFGWFFAAHTLLALAFFSLSVLSSAAVPRWPLLPSGAAWTFYASLYELWVRWRLMRASGYDGLTSGQLPGWFYAAQVGSPFSLYRAFMIVGHPGFRDYEERAVLGQAALPSWMTPSLLGWVFVAVWILTPLVVAAIVWSARRNIERRAERSPDERVGARRFGTVPQAAPRDPDVAGAQMGRRLAAPVSRRDGDGF